MPACLCLMTLSGATGPELTPEKLSGPELRTSEMGADTRTETSQVSDGVAVADIPIEVSYPRTEDFRTSPLYNERRRLVSAALRRAMSAHETKT